jgi:hypothetical protein
MNMDCVECNDWETSLLQAAILLNDKRGDRSCHTVAVTGSSPVPPIFATNRILTDPLSP